MTQLAYDTGNLGETIAGALLALICNGEVQRETLRGEGNGALDLQLKYPSIHGTSTSRQLGVQVKTGRSYVRWHKGRSNWVLQNIDPTHIKKWQDTNQPILIVWVNPTSEAEIYWKFVGANTPSNFLHLTDNHKLSPASLFEIDRLVTISYKKVGGIPKVNVKEFTSTVDARKWAKKEFSGLKGLVKSAIGDIIISNYAWRHLTRISRNRSHIKESLTILPYIKEVLKFIPHQLQTTLESTNSFDNFTVVKRKVLAVYRNVRFNDMNTAIVYIRFHEIIIYPTDWTQNYLLHKITRHTLTLESIYRKPA